MPDKDFTLPTELSDNLKALKDNVNDPEDKTIIGQGRSLADLKKLAQASTIKNDSPIKSEISKSAQSNQSDPLPTVINHADNLIKLLASSFSNSRERVIAENKIRRYFDGFYNV